jgi:hypothetical protein
LATILINRKYNRSRDGNKGFASDTLKLPMMRLPIVAHILCRHDAGDGMFHAQHIRMAIHVDANREVA